MGTKAPIVVVGAGYVGLVTAIGFARARHVLLIDRDAKRIAKLEAGSAPIVEPELQDRLEGALRAGRLSFATDMEGLRGRRPSLVFIAVGTPTARAGADAESCVTEGTSADAADLGSVDEVVDSLCGLGEHAVVMKSTVPPMTGAKLMEKIREEGYGLTYVSCPEFLQEGEAFRGLDRPDRVVVGRDEESWATAELRSLHEDLYGGLPSCEQPPYIEMSVASAELVKLSSNLALAMRVSFANEVGNICEAFGADVADVARGVGSDRRIGPDFLRAGVGFGGSCFEKDLRALRFEAGKANVKTSLVDATLEVNARQAELVIEKLVDHLVSLENKVVALLGLTFKPHTDDLRGSPAFTLAELLRLQGAVVQAWDPQREARERAVANAALTDPPRERLEANEVTHDPIAALHRAHAAVVVTEWPELGEIDWALAAARMAGCYVLDGRNALDQAAVRAAGLLYEGTGRESLGSDRRLVEVGQP